MGSNPSMKIISYDGRWMGASQHRLLNPKKKFQESVLPRYRAYTGLAGRKGALGSKSGGSATSTFKGRHYK
jgi:hypothetical protein